MGGDYLRITGYSEYDQSEIEAEIASRIRFRILKGAEEVIVLWGHFKSQQGEASGQERVASCSVESIDPAIF